MQNQYTVQFNLVKQNIITQKEFDSLKKHLQAMHEPNHRGNSDRCIGDIYHMELVTERVDWLNDEGCVLEYPEGYEIAKRLHDVGICFIEV